MSNNNTVPELPPVLTRKGFKLVRRLGGGGFSVVYEASWSKFPNKAFAAKVIDLQKVDKVWVEKNMKNEMKIMKALSHPNIVGVHEVIKTTTKAYIFMDLARNGSVSDELEKTKKPLTESKAKKFSRDVFNALQYLHSKGVAHRDVKPDNFLIADNEKILLSDFGFACISLNESSDKLMKGTTCGSPEYKALEIKTLKEGAVYDAKASDVYSMGVSLYVMTYLSFPFDFRNESECIRRQRITEIDFTNKFQTISPELIELIRKLLNPDFKTRITCKDVLKHRWFATQ